MEGRRCVQLFRLRGNSVAVAAVMDFTIVFKFMANTAILAELPRSGGFRCG